MCHLRVKWIPKVIHVLNQNQLFIYIHALKHLLEKQSLFLSVSFSVSLHSPQSLNHYFFFLLSFLLPLIPLFLSLAFFFPHFVPPSPLPLCLPFFPYLSFPCWDRLKRNMTILQQCTFNLVLNVLGNLVIEKKKLNIREIVNLHENLDSRMTCIAFSTNSFLKNAFILMGHYILPLRWK